MNGPIRSYYAATCNDQTRYPELAGEVTADVCVIGAGFSGLSTAIFLAERGAKVVVLEEHQVGWGASGRNGGQVIGGLQGEARFERQLGTAGRELMTALHYRGHDIIEERIARYNIQCDWKRGFIEVAAKPSHMAGLEQHVEVQRKAGLGGQLRLLNTAETAKAVGSELYHGAYVDERSAHCHPLNLCVGEARAAASLGVTIHEETRVLGIDHGARPVVRAANGRVVAKQVVLAGNAYHQLEAKKLGGLLFPAGTYVIATEPLSAEVAARINPNNWSVCDSNIALDYFRLSADRRLLFGGLCHYANRDPASIAGALQPRLARVYPELAGTKIQFEWGGVIGIVVTRIPLIGRVAPNVFYLQGYSGHGVNVTHLASEIVADAIDGRDERLRMFEHVRQVRVPGGQWAGNQLLALGMAYYKFKDQFF